MYKLRRTIAVFFIAFLPSLGWAGWLNTSGKVVNMNFYFKTDTVLVKLDKPGVSNDCSSLEYFAIDGGMPAERRQQMISALLSAKAMGQPVTIAYNEVDDCVAYDANPKAYRRIVRVIL